MSIAADRELSSVLQGLVSGLVPQFMMKQLQNASADQDIELTGVWAVDTSWSLQAEELQREILYQRRPLTEEYVIENLRNLRAIDKQITHIDRGMLQYLHLEELVLTGNFISEVQNIPPSLSVLELSLNKLFALDSLDGSPPSTMTHIGLSYNHVTTLSLTPSKWPKLLSLDISFNGVTDMIGAVSVLKQLPSLKSLMFCGNPAALCQGYPSYVVHMLNGLLYIDGDEITDDMRSNDYSWQQNKDILTTSLVTVTTSYSINTSDMALTPTELQEGEKSILIMWYQCSGLPECSTATASSLEDKAIPTDVQQRVLHDLDDRLLVLGPIVMHILAGNEGDKGSTDKAIVVRELSMLKEAVSSGCKVQPMLGYAVLREGDKEVTLQQSSNTQRPTSRAAASPAAKKQLKPTSRGASPAKSPAGKKDKKGASKGKTQQESLEGWKIVQFSVVSLDPVDCELAGILHGASSVTSKRTSNIPPDYLTKLGLLTTDDNTSDATLTIEVNVHVQHY